MKPIYHIRVGYEGPTDACLILSDGRREKEFLIESVPWQILALYHRPGSGRISYHFTDQPWAVLHILMTTDTFKDETKSL